MLNPFFPRLHGVIIAIVVTRHRQDMSLAEIVEYVLFHVRIFVGIQFLDHLINHACLTQHLEIEQADSDVGVDLSHLVL